MGLLEQGYGCLIAHIRQYITDRKANFRFSVRRTSMSVQQSQKHFEKRTDTLQK